MPLKMYERKVPRIIGVASGKGGVGKSTLAVQLALALKRENLKIGILDADLYGPSLRQLLPEEIAPQERGGKIFPALASGLEVISMAHFKQAEGGAILRAPMANQWIAHFINNVVWGALDFLVIDFPPGTADIPLTLAQKASLAGAVIITTPQEIALIDVQKMIKMFRKLSVPIIGVIENMSYYLPLENSGKIFPFGEGGGRRLAEEEKIPFLGEVPLEPELCRQSDRGEPEKLSDHLLQIFSSFAKQILGHSKTEGALFIKTIELRNSSLLSLSWSDGKQNEILLRELQKHCPCVQCQNEKKNTNAEVHATKIEWVGRYAVRVDFVTGCSNGIYEFELLRNL